MKKTSLIMLLLFCLTMTSCADRVRENCETTKETGLFERRCK